MKKEITVDQIITGLRRLKEVGIFPTVSIMVGQPSETREDVQKSISLMLESVRYDKNIIYAFTITTPFPGSELYDIAFKNGILKSHYDFFKRFDPVAEMSKVSVNLSNMSDTEVQEMLMKIQTFYTKAKEEAIGNKVIRIESFRKFLMRYDAAFRRRTIDKFPKGIAFEILVQPYKWLYDKVQTFLGRWTLRLFGIQAK